MIIKVDGVETEVLHSFGENVRTHNDKAFREWVVTPDGRIKTCYYERNVQSALLHVHSVSSGGRIRGIMDVTVPRSLAAHGYVLLRDLYKAEDRMEDWETFQLYQAQARLRHITTPIDDEYLPDEVINRRRNWHVEQGKLDLPPPRKRRQAKGRSFAAAAEDIDIARMMGVPDAANLLRLADEREALANDSFYREAPTAHG